MGKEFKMRLARLEKENYHAYAWVHWSLTIEDRCTGWLEAKFLYKFREILAHTMFRYQLACPIYCLMPDHLHLLRCGLTQSSNQLNAMKQFRKDVNQILKMIGYEFQRQPYDHVLKDDEIEQTAIEDVMEYIARNPERKNLVATDEYARYVYTGCLLPGYPQFKLFQPDSWERLWRTLSFLKRTGCFRIADPDR